MSSSHPNRNTLKRIYIFLVLFISVYPSYSQWNILNWSQDCTGEFFDVNFKSSDTGFVVGRNDLTWDGIVLRTIDEGHTWDDRTPLEKYAMYVDIFYPSNQLIYILGGWQEPHDIPGSGLLSSNDWGGTWIARNHLPTMTYAMHCINDDSCIVVGVQNIYLADNLNWTHTVNWSFSDIGIQEGILYDVNFFNDSCGYACGTYVDNDQRGIVLKTTDYGKNWEIFYQPVEYSSFGSVYASSSDTIYVGGKYKIHTSFDGGQQWMISNLSKHFINPSHITKDPNLNNDVIRSIDFTNDSIGFAVYGLEFEQQNHGTIFRTIDYGSNWTFQDDWSQFNSVHFPSDSTGYVVGDCLTILKTNNLGGIINVSIQESKNNNIELSMYPNPADRELIISAKGISIDEVVIYTLTGQLVFEVRPRTETIDISRLQPGMYIVQVSIENTKIRRKLMVE